jgi:hypothetical protein
MSERFRSPAPGGAGAPGGVGADAGVDVGPLRGANQSLVAFGSSLPSPLPRDLACCCWSFGAGTERVGDAAGDVPVVEDVGPVAAAASASPSSTGLRTTTGGMGRDPGMLIRIRVVSVVSVLGSSGFGASPSSAPLSATLLFSRAASCGGCSDGYWRVPYGGVPEGYAAPPRPWGPEDELSVSRLKAGSPG